MNRPAETQKAQKCINQIINGVFTGIITPLVLMEIISVLRKLLSKSNNTLSTNEINEKISDILINILKIPNLLNNKLSIYGVNYNILRIISGMAGKAFN